MALHMPSSGALRRLMPERLPHQLADLHHLLLSASTRGVSDLSSACLIETPAGAVQAASEDVPLVLPISHMIGNLRHRTFEDRDMRVRYVVRSPVATEAASRCVAAQPVPAPHRSLPPLLSAHKGRQVTPALAALAAIQAAGVGRSHGGAPAVAFMARDDLPLQQQPRSPGGVPALRAQQVGPRGAGMGMKWLCGMRVG